MERASGAVDVVPNQIATKETISTIVNAVLVIFNGRVAIATKENTKTTRGMVTEKCIGPMVVAIKVNGSLASNTDTGG